jgi:hypothetical protein
MQEKRAALSFCLISQENRDLFVVQGSVFGLPKQINRKNREKRSEIHFVRR